MPKRKRPHRYAERVPLMAAQLQRLKRSATRAELYDALRTGPDGLFAERRRVDATFRYDQKQPQPVFQRERRDRIALRKPCLDTLAQAVTGPIESRVYERGQTVVPKKIRDAMGVEEGSALTWEVQDGVAQVVAVPRDPIRGAIGILRGKGPTFEEFLADRDAERARERELEADQERRWHTYSTRQRS